MKRSPICTTPSRLITGSVCCLPLDHVGAHQMALPKKCAAIARLEKRQCMNLAKWVVDGEFRCGTHAPRKYVAGR